MTSFHKLLLALCLLANPGIAAEETSRGTKNTATLQILRSTPVSVMSYGIERLDDDLRDVQKMLFKDFKQDNEYVLLQAFDTYVMEPEFSPVIMIRTTLASIQGDINRSKYRAEELCAKMLENIAVTVGIYLDDNNNYFNDLWESDVTSTDYKKIDVSDIQNLVFLKARIKHSGSKEFISCGRFY